MMPIGTKAFGWLTIQPSGLMRFEPVGKVELLTPDKPEVWLSVKEAAAISGWSPWTIYSKVSSGDLRSRRASRNKGMEVLLSSVERLLNQEF